MKVLRIYDHLGELKKEFNLYVDGYDFKWEASVPEVIWLGTISIEELSKYPEAEPTPEAEAVEFVSMVEVMEAEKEPEMAAEAVSGPLEQEPEEVKDEPEKVHRKRSRVKRSASSASPESTEGLYQEDSGEDNHKGD